MNRQVNLPTPALLVVTALDDPVTDSLGHRPGSPYVEDVWLGVLGPTTTWAWLRLARVAEQSPGSTLDMADLARSLGLGTGTGPNAPISRTLGRLVVFGAAQRSGDTLMVRRALHRGKPERIDYGGLTADAHNGADQAMALDLLAALEGHATFPVTPWDSMEAGLTVMAIDRAMAEGVMLDCAPMWAAFDEARGA